MKFNCIECGECCRNLNKSEVYKNLHTGDGVCIYLKGNSCSIYEDRFLLCRIEESYEFFKEQFSKDEYYKLNYEICKILIKNQKNEI